tara:strand:+ start:832 stop:939 length:108 start_codon:yes stop_codon:yes gene_type:complete
MPPVFTRAKFKVPKERNLPITTKEVLRGTTSKRVA